jgi:hypothetical protein
MTITIVVPRLPGISSWKINSIKLQTWIDFLKENIHFVNVKADLGYHISYGDSFLGV